MYALMHSPDGWRWHFPTYASCVPYTSSFLPPRTSLLPLTSTLCSVPADPNLAHMTSGAWTNNPLFI
jgi:hypothetical protein